MESCTKHPHELGVGLCGRCGLAWCAECLVFAFGPKKPPFCVDCAMFAGGVRSGAPRPAMGRRELKARMKAWKAAERAAAAAREEAAIDDAAAAVAVTPAAPTTDWQTPWWEDSRQPTFAD